MATDREITLAMLERRGYTKAESTDPNVLGDKEYTLFNVPGANQILQFGSGRTGEDGCYFNLYFDINGNFVEHSAEHDPQEASNLD